MVARLRVSYQRAFSTSAQSPSPEDGMNNGYKKIAGMGI